MPEISQDAFESLFPAKPPATVQELRRRANSTSDGYTINDDCNLDSSVFSFDDFNDHLFNNINNTNISGQEQIYGYKRESSHR